MGGADFELKLELENGDMACGLTLSRYMIIRTEIDQPILFRTVGKDVYEHSIRDGSLWLRTSDYYRNLEDLARADRLEGVGGTKTHIPLRFKGENSSELTIQGSGTVGRVIVPHYILSLHGTAISDECQHSFGGYTFGVKSITRLAAEVLYKASKQLNVHAYRFGPVSYQNTALCISHGHQGAAVAFGGNPPLGLGSIDTDVLRKEPVEPFISQDEWRIVIFPSSYMNDDPDEPLKINVSPDLFFEYIRP